MNETQNTVIEIGNEIRVRVLRTWHDRVLLGVVAPDEMAINRRQTGTAARRSPGEATSSSTDQETKRMSTGDDIGHDGRRHNGDAS